MFADEEERGGSAVIGSSVGILGDTAPEFAERHQEDAAKVTLRFEIISEGFHRIAKILEKALLSACLVGVRVITALGEVINARGHPAADEAREEMRRARDWLVKRSA